MGRSDDDLRDYYEREARLRRRRPPRGRRVDLRSAFIDRLAAEGRASVLDLGGGPGRDAEAFEAAGHRVVGIDLANGNAVLAAELGLLAIQGSVTALPIRSSSFDAGWSMSVLMHLDDASAAEAAAELARALRPGAPAVIGLWGRESEELIVESDELPGSRRPFHLRSFEHNRDLVARLGTLEAADHWPDAAPGEDYQVFHLRRS